MYGKSNGFTLVEIIIAIVILAITAAIVVPRLTRRPVPLEKEFTRRLNELSRFGQLNALMTGALQRIHFDLKRQQVVLERASARRDSLGHLQFEPVKISHNRTSFQMPKDLEIDRFWVKGKNLIQKGEGIQATGVWFYLVPEGLSQEVTIDFHQLDSQRMFSIVINPFNAQFSVKNE